MFKAILKGSVQLCLTNFDNLIKAAGAWTVVLILLNITHQMAGFGNQATIQQMARQNPGQFWFVMTVSIVLQLIASSSIAVAWHRFALLGERPAMIHLRFGRPEFRYFLYSLLLALLMVLVVAGIAFLALVVTWMISGLPFDWSFMPPVPAFALIGFVLVSPVLMRVGLMLPAAAVDEPMGPFRADRFGKGLGWPMAFATICLIIPFMVLDFAITFLIAGIGSELPQILVGLQFIMLKGLEQIIITVLLLSVITVAYAHARRRHEMTAGPIDPAV